MEMSKFIENLKKYLENRKIRQTYVSLMTGWDKSRVSKILSGTIDLKESEAEFLAKALGHDMSYFLTDFSDQYKEQAVNGQLAFFASTLNDEDKKTADTGNCNIIFFIKDRFLYNRLVIFKQINYFKMKYLYRVIGHGVGILFAYYL